MRMRLLVLSASVVLAFTCAGLAGASSRSSGRVFYLSTHPRECLVSVKSSPKWVQVVPCSNSAHNMEVYAIVHGGWGHRTPPPSTKALSIARSLCLAAFQRVTGHPLATTQGWNAFWPDPGSETARYGDKVICSLSSYPRLGPLGSGWHVH